jgi:hypothetical protein
MVYMMVMLLSLWTRESICREYHHVRDIMEEDKMILNWEVEEETLFFKLSGQTSGYVGLAFSFNDLPQDGFIAGVDEQGEQYHRYLHLNHTGRESEDSTVLILMFRL